MRSNNDATNNHSNREDVNHPGLGNSEEEIESDNLNEDLDEAVSDDVQNGLVNSERSWVLEQGPVDKQPLDDILDYPYFKEDVSKTGIRFMPVGLKTFFRRMRQRKKCSQQTIQYHASRHGCLIVVKDERVKKLMRLYEQKLKRAEEGADVALLRRLEERNEKVDYTYPEEVKTSVAMAKNMFGLLSNLSDAIGVSNIKLYCWLCIVSALTLKKPVAHQKILEDEAKHFWTVIEERIAWLTEKTQEH